MTYFSRYPFYRVSRKIGWESYLCRQKNMISSEDLLRTFLPEWLFDYFEVVNLEQRAESLHVHLDEKKVVPKEFVSRRLISHGFDEAVTVQDFPVKGKAVYLHLRKRRWLDVNTNQILSRKFDIAHQGTRLTKEFVSFLKATNRE
jgi:hypothetical protein